MIYFHNNILIKINYKLLHSKNKKCSKIIMKLDLFLTKHMYGDNNNNQFFMSKHENIYIKHVFDFRITKHINTNHDNIVSLEFFLIQ